MTRSCSDCSRTCALSHAILVLVCAWLSFSVGVYGPHARGAAPSNAHYPPATHRGHIALVLGWHRLGTVASGSTAHQSHRVGQRKRDLEIAWLWAVFWLLTSRRYRVPGSALRSVQMLWTKYDEPSWADQKHEQYGLDNPLHTPPPLYTDRKRRRLSTHTGSYSGSTLSQCGPSFRFPSVWGAHHRYVRSPIRHTVGV